ncbi:PREDICTED: uncharacterized protein LOC108370631 [Rhagoletis zephyria]|uniref:uncharacterized protein LOC108370631 n=1 Tax=Rhagoletis zephyria TaxID=28612 RepID=UPI0008112117|nr:PREDICTED: uncharacterized protein LOC108370631 [Rhagoletis zephyria]
MSTPDISIMSSTENLLSKLSKEVFSGSNASQHNVDFEQSHAPAWLTKDYLERCLRSHHQDSHLKILKWHIRPALGKGENYGGVLSRIRADYQTGAGTVATGHYVVKTSYEADEFARKTMEPYDIFNREMSIYEQVLPKLNALLHEIGDNEQIFAETMAVDRERSALIFEDLNVREFIMPNRLDGLNMDLSRMVLRKIAKMHATSAVLNERESGCLEIYDRGFFNQHTDNYMPGFEGLMMACSRRVAQWEGYEYYAQKLASLKSNYAKIGKKVFEATPGHVNVLAHGDLWTNNVMVKYNKNTGEPLDVIIIDFQYATWGSPALDLDYFLNTSLEERLHLNQQDELIRCYYETFSDTLRKLRYQANIPCLHKFHLQLEEKAFYAFHSTCIVLPIQRNTDTEDADFRAIMQDDERGIRFKDTCFKNPYVQRIIKQLLPLYERRGLLEVTQ